MSIFRQAMGQWSAGLCLLGAGAMLICGQTILGSRLRGMVFLLYWFVCLLLTVAAMVLALRDVRAVRRRIREERQRLLEKSFGDLPAPPGEPTPPADPGA